MNTPEERNEIERMTNFSIEDLKALEPCEDGLEYCRQHATLSDAWEKCKRPDWMLWFLEKTGILDDILAVRFACECAKRVLPLFQKEYPDDKRPEQALEAALAWLENGTPANASVSASASAAAYTALAYAASASAYSALAYAASASAYSAAYAYSAATAAYASAASSVNAAYAIRYAYSAAYASASSAGYSAESSFSANMIREFFGNPFKKL